MWKQTLKYKLIGFNKNDTIGKFTNQVMLNKIYNVLIFNISNLF